MGFHCCCSVGESCPPLCDPRTVARQTPLCSAVSRTVLTFMSIESMMPSNHLILCRPLLLLPSIFPSIRVFSNDLAIRIRWPKDWSFSFSIHPSNEYSGLVSFRIDWFDLSAVQGNLKSLLQHHSRKASILWCSASFMVQLSYPFKCLLVIHTQTHTHTHIHASIFFFSPSTKCPAKTV